MISKTDYSQRFKVDDITLPV